MRDLHTEFKHRKIKNPNPVIAYIVQVAFKIICKKRNAKFVFDKDYLDMADSQMVVFCQHKSKSDYIYLFAGLKRRNLHFLCGYQNIFQPYVYGILKRLGVIAKLLYQPDVQATKQILQGVKLGNSIAVFPEGIQSTSGSTHPINPATLKLLKKLKLPVALVTIKGSYFTQPRYTKDIKKGEITVKFSKLFSSEDFDNLTDKELYARLLERFQYNEFLEHEDEKIAFYGKEENIAGLDNIIYKCPACGGEHQFKISEQRMRCSCGFEVMMDEYFDIHPSNGSLPFKNIDEWYKWQRKCVGEEVRDDDFSMSAAVSFGKINTERLGPNYSLMYVGEGILTINNKGLRYKGTRYGEDVDLFFTASAVYSLSMSLQYDMDLYYNDKYYNFKLLENEKSVVKWMLAAEEIHNLYDGKWKKSSEEVYANAQ